MANRRFRTQFIQGYAVPVVLRMTVSFGATGAPTIATGTGMGIKSIVRNSAGDYTITLNDEYNNLLGINHIFNSGSAAPAAPTMYIKSDSIASAGTVEIVFNSIGTTPAATDPASGEKVLLEIVLNQTQLAY